MKAIVKVLCIQVLVLFFFSCENNNTKDDTKPIIDLSAADNFPNNCDTLYFGEEHTFRLHLSDNKALGNLAMGIHHNFDHHTHSTELDACEFDSKKEAVNPYLHIEDYSLPEGITDYVFVQTIVLANANESGSFDEGDYHLYLTLTDATGWSTLKGLSIKILRRE